MVQNSINQQIYRKVNAASGVKIIIHRKPDGDTLGAALAWHNFFKQQKKPSTIFSYDNVPENYLFLPAVEDIIASPQELKIFPNEVIITVDTDISQTGIEDLLQSHRERIINIDHHVSNTNFGQINLVNFAASSTCEILFFLFKDLEIRLTPAIATCLYSGLFIDTSSFTNAATNFQSLAIAAELLSAGAHFRKVARQLSENRSLNSLRLWGIALNRLRYNQQLKLVITVITQADLDQLSATEEEIEGIANFLNNLNHPEAQAVMVLRESDDGIRGSLRTTREDINVSRLAEFLGGGGHKKAAGFRLPGKIIKQNGAWRII